MDLPKCKICGTNHRLGSCPQNTSHAKATKGKSGTARVKDPVRRSSAGTGLQVGEAVAVQPATSEIMDAMTGETAPKFDREAYHRNYMRRYMAERRAKAKQDRNK